MFTMARSAKAMFGLAEDNAGKMVLTCAPTLSKSLDESWSTNAANRDNAICARFGPLDSDILFDRGSYLRNQGFGRLWSNDQVLPVLMNNLDLIHRV